MRPKSDSTNICYAGKVKKWKSVEKTDCILSPGEAYSTSIYSSNILVWIKNSNQSKILENYKVYTSLCMDEFNWLLCDYMVPSPVLTNKLNLCTTGFKDA